jgi:dTDP-glucose 4,6-dehydratase
MNLLVTGGAGFIGSHLLRRLLGRPGISKVVNLDCLTYAGHLQNLAGMAQHPNYVFEKVDLRDKPAVLGVVASHRVTHVVHLAAESHVDRSISGPGDFIHTNVVGTFHLLDACRAVWGGDMGGKRFLHVSTDEVYGSIGPVGSYSEAAACAPNSPYSASKAASDMLVRSYHQTYGLPVVITRSSNNYGSGQNAEKLIPTIIARLLRRAPVPIYGDGLNVRDWLHVEDHCDALWLALTAGADGEIYNIGGRAERTNLQIASLICEIFDDLAPRSGGGSSKLITFVQDRPGHDRRYAMNGAKFEKATGWIPSLNFEPGLRETVKWYLDNVSWFGAAGRG